MPFTRTAGSRGWSVVDIGTGRVITVRGQLQLALGRAHADDTVALLNYLETDRPDLLVRLRRPRAG